MKDRTSRRTLVRGIAVVGAVLIAAGAISPAFSAFKPTKKNIKRIAKKVAKKEADAVSQEIGIFGGSFTRVSATAGADEAGARVAAPKVPLLTKGPLSVYGKCFSYPADTVAGELFIETTAPGAIFSGEGADNLAGGAAATDLLNPDTPETDRQIHTATAGADTTNYSPADNSEVFAMAPGGTALEGVVNLAIKNGTLAGGNGVYGNGDVCLFAGHLIGT